MPLKDDLIQRTLEQLAGVVRGLLGLRLDPEEAERVIARAYAQHTGGSAALLRRLSVAELLPVLSSAGTLDREKAYLLAGLSEAEAALEVARGRSDGSAYRVRALALYLEAALAGLELPELGEGVARLRAELSGYVLSEATEWRMFAYLEQTGDYAGAEDRLFGLLERAGPSEAALAGRAFYRRLLLLPDAVLDAGDLPRAEVLEGQRALEAMLGDA